VDAPVNSRKRSALFFEEPFRVFFPVGLVLGAIGVALWPMFVWRVIHFYPAEAHVRLMIEGLMGSFIIGFLGTAGPRLLDAHPFKAFETSTLLALQLLSASLQLARQQLEGDIIFLALLLYFLAAIGLRARKRAPEDLPPPSFVLVLIGYFNAIAGITLILAAKAMVNGFFANRLGALMLNEGFVLFPILGVGAFFFPKMLGGASPQRSDLQMAKVQWKKKAAVAAAAGVLILASFGMEAADWTRSAALLRGITAVLYFTTQGRLLGKPAGPSFLANCFRLGTLLLGVGLLLPTVLPAYRLANLHVTFLGGFTVILFTVSTRVIIGHSGQQHLFQKRMRFLSAALTLLLLAMTARVAADFSAPLRNSHLVYAALIWLGAAAVWAWALSPKLLLSDERAQE
jgi:uncharacterized protein involved in response to NO